MDPMPSPPDRPTGTETGEVAETPPSIGARLRQMARRYAQPARFAAVGILNTAIDIAVFSALHFGAGADLLLANSLGFAAGLTNSFFCNKYWTFRETRRHGRMSRQLPAFAALNLVALGLSNATVWCLALLVPVLAAKVAAVGVTFVWNYWTSRRFIYTPDFKNFSARSNAS